MPYWCSKPPTCAKAGRNATAADRRDNPEFTVDTHWYHIDAPTRACFTETVIAGGQRFGVSLVTYVLAPDGPATTLTVDVAVASMTGEDMQGDFHAGWTSGLDRLERLIRSGELK